MSHHCQFCNLHFTSLPAFYRHRTGEGEARRCMTEQEMFGEGLRVGTDYAARNVIAKDVTPESHPEQFARYITAPVERHRPVYEKKEPIQHSHVRWLFQRGISPDKINKAGIPASVVAKVVTEEVRKLQEKSPAG
jgi:hypothetical protein